MAIRDSNGRFIKGSGSGGTKFRDTDKGFDALKIRLTAAARGATLSVGIHEVEGSEQAEGSDDATLIEVAAYNEFGGPDNNPPQRSFIAAWADENTDAHRDMLRKSSAAVVKGKLPSLTVALERLGLRFVGDVQQRIRAGISPENAESTIARKGSSTPLIEGGQLWTSVTHQVEQGTK
jgi:hypothetical protein